MHYVKYMTTLLLSLAVASTRSTNWHSYQADSPSAEETTLRSLKASLSGFAGRVVIDMGQPGWHAQTFAPDMTAVGLRCLAADMPRVYDNSGGVTLLRMPSSDEPLKANDMALDLICKLPKGILQSLFDGGDRFERCVRGAA